MAGDEEIPDTLVSMADRYRTLATLVDRKRPQLITSTDSQLLSLVKEVNELPHIDQTPRERLLDARLFCSLAQCGNAKARRMSGDHGPQSPQELILAIKAKYRIDEPRVSMEGDAWEALDDEIPQVKIDWERMGEDLLWMFSASPGMRCMRGFVTEIEQKKPAQSRPKSKRERPAGNAAAPEKHAARDLTSSATETERVVNKIWKILNAENVEEMSLKQLTLDHDSFPQTVVNVFHVMFLIKDGKVRVNVNEDESITIKPIKDRHSRHRPDENQQEFISLTTQLWERWKSELPRQACKMHGYTDDEDEETVSEDDREEDGEDAETLEKEASVHEQSSSNTAPGIKRKSLQNLMRQCQRRR